MIQQQGGRLRRFLCRAFTLTVLTAILSFTAAAQQDYARLEGVVRDATGGLIPGATVTVRSPALSVERTTTTSDEGVYTIPQLRPGIYTVTVTQQGFSTANVKDLELGVGQARTLDIELTTGEVAAQVDVSAGDQAATIDTSSNRIGVNVTAREVEELPVNGRNYSQLYTLAPGSTNTGTGNFSDFRFNGRANQQNQTKLDGIEATAIFDSSPGYLTVQGSQFRLQTSLENIQEFRVDSSNYPAEYGTGTGGQINVIGKSGTNEYHGALFYYLRNDALDARNFFDGAEASKLRLNQFGGSFGGPVIKDRFFFFGSYEGLRQRAGFNIIEVTPSTIARDFANFFGTADPRGEAARATLGITPADANAALTRIQALRATGVINAFPIGSGPFITSGTNNAFQEIRLNRTARLDENAFSIRLDGKLNERFNIYGRYQRTTGDLESPDGSTGRLLLATQEPDNFVVALQQLYGTSMVNETKFGINRAPTTLQTSFPQISGSTIDFSLSSINFGTITNPGVNGGAPTGIASPGGLTRQSSAGNGRAQPIDPSSYSFIDNLSVTKGNHNMKFGGELRLIRVNFDQLGGFTYTYSNIGDFLLNRNVTASFIGDLSAPGNFTVATVPPTVIDRPIGGFSEGRQYYLIGYGQDEWRIRPNVTLNYGLRYEYFSPNREKNNRQVVFDPATGRLLSPDRDVYVATKSNFGPRLALTWAPARFNNKTVIRVGGGLYYGPGQYEDLIQPIESNVFRTSRSVTDGLTSSLPASLSSTTAPVTSFTPRAYDVNGYRVPERVAQYGISVQQELPGNTVVTIGYVGSQGRNLFLRSITNTIRPGQTIIGPTATLESAGFVGVINRCSVDVVSGQCPGVINQQTTVRQYSIVSGNTVSNPFGEIDYKLSGGTDNFNALQVTVNRRFTAGLTLGGNYQWGHSIGNTQGSNEAQTSQDPFNYRNERGNNTFDVRHSANFSVLYELPIGRGKRYNLEGIADTLFGGIQLGGIYNGRSGTPLDIRVVRPDLAIQCVDAARCTLGQVRALPSTINATTPIPAGFIAVVNTPGGGASRGTRRPDIIQGVNPFLNIGGNLRILNPAAFAIPRPGTYGNLSRNALYGPSFHQFDLTFQKRFRFTETTNIEFRTEVYNIFNKANFANPPAALPNNLGSAATSQQPGQPYTFDSATGATNAGNFGVINGTVGRTVGLGTNRQIQFALRLNF